MSKRVSLIGSDFLDDLEYPICRVSRIAQQRLAIDRAKPITQLADDGVLPNDQKSFTVEVRDGSVPVRITLVYTDFPGEDLINNLNLFAFEPGGPFHVGNDFDGNGQPDSDSNVEGIVVENPSVGTWEIRVVGSNVPETPQSFAVVISGGDIHLAEAPTKG